jgi:hypothetical protein
MKQEQKTRGNPKKNRMFTMRLTDKDLAELHQFARKNGTTVSAVIRAGAGAVMSGLVRGAGREKNETPHL